ncbi:DUF262 domain-containing protein [Yersinia enterocolitica]|uniref:Uncharacterized conserved protein n=1 Tax=Yersinia enterocolitica TaxID=630 RepID=A0A0H5GU19_YEREN|nr:DUF262 domain-containing protein [Yersinia enterocolitica]EKN3328472.1 DUF262 domain-containing protein [Yersinia enterocolitica]EKN3413148.1 DUF262 domain-containing protein [Yersinia enterocolitica]EKN3494543.1 DUF262 domain-containing protein [Yersinia enterocolitica]EKN3507637.1 DUF262 domain-containing protein [Yersinia enterocolitica]EKN3555447.1 DUF262 domain-containing protein [Yersinia enterocolitica]
MTQPNNSEEQDTEFEGDDSLDISVHPHPLGINTEIRIAKDQYSVYELLRKEQQKRVVLAPDFQRNDVWERRDKSELVESVLMGIPVPLIYMFEDENGVRQVVDGKQRITALKQFLNGDYRLTDLIMLSNLSGKNFCELDPLLQSRLEDYQIAVYVIQPPTPEKVKFSIFERVNRSGTKLNKQEMRHALYQGKATDLIQELAESHEFKLATGYGVKSERMRDRYLVLRFVGFYLLVTGQLKNIEYRSDIDAFLAAVMKYINKSAPDSVIENVKLACLHGMKNIYDLLGGEAFRFRPKSGGKRRPINMGLFEMLTFAFCYLTPSNVDSDNAILITDNYKNNIDDQGIFSGVVDTSDYVKLRFDMAQEIIRGLNNDK